MDPEMLKVVEEAMETNKWLFIGELSNGKLRVVSPLHEHSKEHRELLLLAYKLATTPCDDDCKHDKLSDWDPNKSYLPQE